MVQTLERFRKILEALSGFQIILISRSTLVNKTLNDILQHVTNAREVVLLGPTASVIPHPLFKRRVTVVMGVRITDPEKMLKVVGEGSGTQQLLATRARKTALMKKVFEQLGAY